MHARRNKFTIIKVYEKGLAFIVIAAIAFSHFLANELCSKTIVDLGFCAWFYLIATLPIALVYTIERRDKKSISFAKHFALAYVVCIMILGSFVSLLFFAPNYYLADKRKSKEVITDIIGIGILNHRYHRSSYIEVRLQEVNKTIDFRRDQLEDLKRGTYSIIEVYEGFFGKNIIGKVTIYDVNHRKILSKE